MLCDGGQTHHNCDEGAQRLEEKTDGDAGEDEMMTLVIAELTSELVAEPAVVAGTELMIVVLAEATILSEPVTNAELDSPTGKDEMGKGVAVTALPDTDALAVTVMYTGSYTVTYTTL